MNAAWYPFSSATTIESSATIVLPDPTSPWTRRFMGCGDLTQDALLGAGQVEGQDALDRLPRPIRDRQGGALGPLLARLVLQGVSELEEEELLQDEPTMRRAARGAEQREIVVLPRAMDPAQRLRARDDGQPLAQVLWQWIGKVVRDLFRQAEQDAAQGLAGERPQLLVDGDDAAGVDPGRVFALDLLVLGRRHHELARSVGVRLDRPVEDDLRSPRQRVLQEGLVEPQGLQPTRPVLEADLVEGETAGPTQSGHRDRARHGDLHARTEVDDPGQGRAGLVAHGQEAEAVLDGGHALAFERLRPLRAHALDELHGRGEVHGRDHPTTAGRAGVRTRGWPCPARCARG